MIVSVIYTYPCGFGEIVMRIFAIKTIFMHDPISLFTSWSSSSIKHKCFLHPNETTFAFEDLLILPGRFPIPGLGRTVRPHPGRVLPVPLTEEVKLFLPHLCSLCTHQKKSRSLSFYLKRSKKIELFLENWIKTSYSRVEI